MDTPVESYRPIGALPADPLATYAGPWDVRLAAHLMRRAGFGGAPADVARLAQLGMRRAVDSYVNFAPTKDLPDAPPMPDNLAVEREIRAMIAAGTAKPGDPQVVELRKAQRKEDREATIALQTWWIDRMIATPAPLQEKMTLLWHGHFTTTVIEKGVSPAEMLGQNALYRQYALGDVRELARRVALDPAMLKYLDNIHNDAAHPNENFAREFMELYTLGIGNYTESDVREAARAWSGYRARPLMGDDVTLVPRLHDDGTKTFLGQTGNFAGDDIVRIVFDQPACAKFFATKLLTWFVYADPEPELVDAVADLLRRHKYILYPVMATILSSKVFYSDRAYRALVKSPVEFVVGTYRLFGIQQSSPIALDALRRMTQVLFYPPNVKGWPGGSAWLSSATVLARENFANAVMTSKVVDASSWLLAPGPSDSGTAARAIVASIVQGDASADALARVRAYLDGAGTTADAALSVENFDQRMRGAAYLTMAMPAYQLA